MRETTESTHFEAKIGQNTMSLINVLVVRPENLPQLFPILHRTTSCTRAKALYAQSLLKRGIYERC